MKNLEKKLRKLGFEVYDINYQKFLEFKINREVRIRVVLSSKKFNYFKEGSYEAFLSTWLPFSSIKDLKKQVKEKTGIVLKKDKPVTKKKLKKYGWVDCEESDKLIDHQKIEENGIYYDFNDNTVTSHGLWYTPCPTMSQLKSYVLEHTGEKMQKVKKDKEVPNIDSNIDSVSVESLKHIELPKRWEDIDLNDGMQVDWIDECSKIETSLISSLQEKADKNILPKGLGYPMLATCQLLLLRDIYRQGWKPDWSDSSENKFCIMRDRDKITTTNSQLYSNKWSFKDAKTRDLFLENFKPLLQEHYKICN